LSSISLVYQYYFVFSPISSSYPVISAHFRPSPLVAKSDSTILGVHAEEKFKRKDVRAGTFKDVSPRDDREKTNKDRQTGNVNYSKL
jgi:hypothetical protein